MTLEELIDSGRRREFAALPEADALTQEDALQEADLRDIQYCSISRRLTMLFDLRNSLQFYESDTAAVVLRGVCELHVTESSNVRQGWFSRYVIGWVPTLRNGELHLEVLCTDGFSIKVSALAAEFFVGNIPGLTEAPPNFPEDDEETIVAGMPAWTSEFEPGWATFLDPGHPRVTTEPGAIGAALAELVAPALPSRVVEVEYADPVAGIRGASWVLTLVCAWRLWRDDDLVIDPDVIDGDETVTAELVADALSYLVGQSVIEVRNSDKNVNDPVFLLAGGYLLEVEAETDLDPWTFSRPGMTFVGTKTAG